MEYNLLQSTKYFKTYEQREEAFGKSVFSLISRRYAGPGIFWKDFSSIPLEALLELVEHPIAYITSNPQDCLAFGTPWQILTAAGLCAQQANKKDMPSADQIARDFGLYENLFQPIRTLSGGETVKLALAKSYIHSWFSHKLSIASPFSWLSRDNAVFFQRLYDHYVHAEKRVELFALEGEDSHEPIGTSRSHGGTLDNHISLGLCLKNVRIQLDQSLNPMASHDTYAEIEDLESDLISPCLVVGENGQGKSLVAKVFTGALSFQGSARILCEDKTGPARLLFQDVITQTLLRSFDRIASSSDNAQTGNALEPYEEIFNEYFSVLGEPTEQSVSITRHQDTGFRSLLEVKAILVAARLCGQPCALFLDEPDWGLSRASAIAFVLAVIRVAHKLGTPVFLISHKPWWSTVAKSTIHVTRTGKDKAQNDSFQIRLTPGAPK